MISKHAVQSLLRANTWLAAMQVVLLAAACLDDAHAAIQVQATRVIYDAKSASAAVALSNKSALPYMVQTWLDVGEETAPGEQAVVRTIYAGSGLPTERESLLWINVQEIPPSAEASNVLQVAIRTRIKLFYRPAELNTSLDQAARRLRWRINGDHLQVSNGSPLHITFSHLQGLATAGAGSEVELDMIAPGQTLSVPLAKLVLDNDQLLSFGYINDYGGSTDVTDVPLAH